MIAGALLAGCMIRAVVALVLLKTVWVALLIYSGTGMAVRAGPLMAALCPDNAPQLGTDLRFSALPKRAFRAAPHLVTIASGNTWRAGHKTRLYRQLS